jgi:hypothetical protein
MTTLAVRRQSRFRRTAAGLLTLLVAAGAACSDGASGAGPAPARVNPMQYAVNVCGRMQSWLDEIEGDVANLSRKGAAVRDDPVARKPIFVDTAAAIRGRTAAALADLDSYGVPAVDNGQVFATTLRRAVVEADKIQATAEQVVRDLPADDKETFIYRGAELTQQIEQSFAHVRLAYDLLVRQFAATDMWEGFTRDVCRNYDDPRT